MPTTYQFEDEIKTPIQTPSITYQFEDTPSATGMPEPTLTPFEERLGKVSPTGLGLYGAAKEAIVKPVAAMPESMAKTAWDIGKGLTYPIRHPIETSKIPSKIGSAIFEHPIETAEAIWNTGSEVVKQRYGSLENLKNSVQKDPMVVLGDIATVVGGIGGLIKGAGAITGIEGLSKLGTEAIEAGAKTFTKPYSVAAQVAGKVASKIPLGGGDLATIVRSGISKGIRPSVETAGKTYPQRKIYYEKSTNAVENIIKNKNNLELLDEAGHEVKGLPKSLDQFTQAIHQTKKDIFKQYDTLAKQAGEQGVTVNLDNIVQELGNITQRKEIQTFNPEIIKYVNQQIDNLRVAKSLTAEEAQNAITILNKNLEAFYKNPSYDTASKARVDSLIANNLRTSLDNVIEAKTGAQYQELKNAYGSLKTIEKDVNRRTIIDARKNIKGLIDFSDIFSGATVVHGLISSNPATIASAATAKGIKMWYKYKTNPNNIIKNMFERADKTISLSGGEISKISKFKKAIETPIIAGTAITVKQSQNIQDIPDEHLLSIANKQPITPSPQAQPSPQNTGRITTPKPLSEMSIEELMTLKGGR